MKSVIKFEVHFSLYLLCLQMEAYLPVLLPGGYD